jgi:hypothetical protein
VTVLEVACDESGYEGEKLIGANNDVFAHGSVQVDIGSADRVIREARARVRSPATEYKANHFLRDKHRTVLEWMLGPEGPLLGRARVFLVDKAFHVVSKVVDLLLGSNEPAIILCREGRRALDPAWWHDFLVAANDLMRDKDPTATSVDAFFLAVSAVREPGSVDGILALLARSRPRAQIYRDRLHDTPAMIPGLDPLFPAIVAAIVHWGAGGVPVELVHDRQKTLSTQRIARLAQTLPDPSTFAGLRLVDSFVDARVQLADILAGVARKISSDELNDRGDAELTALLRPYVDPSSVWGDDRSWSMLTAV